jgi:CheY-like chemotaxis protein
MSLNPELTATVVDDGRARRKSPCFPMTVFVADDDEAMREAVATSLRVGGHYVVEARDGSELLDRFRGTADAPPLRPDVVVADVRMLNLSGLGVLSALRRAKWNVPVLLITALADESVRPVARRLGAIGILRKPFETEDLLTAVLNAGEVLSARDSSGGSPDRPREAGAQPPVSRSGVHDLRVEGERSAPYHPMGRKSRI